jgi:signal transduction histidine kinase
MKLATKIIAISLAMIVALTALAGYFSMRNKYQEFELAQRKLAQVTATTLRQELDRAWSADGIPGVVRFLEQANSASAGAFQVHWVWLDGLADPSERPRIEIDPNSIPFGETFSVVASDESGRRNLYTYVPIQLVSNRPGALEFAESLAPLEQRMWSEVLFTLGLIGAVALVSIATAYVTGISWVARPLQKLIAKTQRIGRGDFSGPLVLRSHDELAQLAQALNDMCGRLDEQTRAIASESEQRLAVLDQLRHSDRLKTVGRLAAGVGHELGTPLNVISGRAALISSGKLGHGEILESARMIKDEADRIAGIVRQLLDFARRRAPQRAPLDLLQVLARTVELLQPMAEKNSVRIELQGAEGDGRPASAMVQADAGQLQQVFTNIIVNAIQAMPRGGVASVAVTATMARNPLSENSAAGAPYWRVSFSDEGCGIDPEHLEHVFEPFFTTKDVSEGTGLGLSIAYGIVQEHQGWIEVVSEVDQGSRFDVFLPRE